MSLVGGIQPLIANPGGSGANAGVPLLSAGKFYTTTATGGVAYLTRFSILGGVQEKQAAVVESIDDFGVDPFGRVYFPDSLSNFCSFTRYDADLNLDAQWGTSNTFWNVPSGLPYPLSGWAGVSYGNQAIMLGSTLRFLSDPDPPMTSGYMVWQQTAVPFFFGRFDFYDEPAIQAVPGFSGSSSATLFLIGGPHSSGDDQHLALYSLVVPATAGATLITNAILPATIDPTWTHIFHGGMVYDASDGHLIVPVSTDEAVTQPGYICKFNSSTGALMWQVPVDGVDVSAGQVTTRHGRVRGGRYCYFTSVGSNPKIAIINTYDGTYSIQGPTGLAGVFGGNQCFDSDSGAVLIRCNFSSTTGSPVVLSGPSSWSSQWAALYVIDAIQPPPNSGSSYTQIWGNYP